MLPAHQAQATVRACTEAGLDAALSAGGTNTFSCSGPTTIAVSGTKTIYISGTVLDGGGLLTLSGSGVRQIFQVNIATLALIQNMTIINGSGINGGAIVSNGSLSVINSTFANNTANAYGGAIMHYDQGGNALTAFNSTFTGNSAMDGGALSDAGGTLTVGNSTFSGNVAGNRGGGIYVSASANATIINSTFSGNSASPGNGASVFAWAGATPGTATLRNTIAIKGGSSAPNCNTQIAAGADSMADDSSCGSATVRTAGQIGLGALTGSPAYFPLTAGSAAIDAGDNTYCAAPPINNTSQNGVPRPADGDGIGGAVCDIGSYEAAMATFGVTYNGNGNTAGTPPVDSTAYAPGASVTVRANTGGLAKTGFGFSGWNTQANGGGTSYAPGATFTMGAANVNLYANWVANSFSGTSPTGTGTIVASFTPNGSCSYAVSQFIPVTGNAASPPAGTAPAGVNFSQGLFDFRVTGCTPGATLNFTIVYPQQLPFGTQYWKYGPTSTNSTPHWYVLPNAVVNGNTITFSITDGGVGDDDYALGANGIIVDQGGPGITPPTQIPALSEWSLLLLAGLLLLLALHKKRA